MSTFDKIAFFYNPSSKNAKVDEAVNYLKSDVTFVDLNKQFFLTSTINDDMHNAIAQRLKLKAFIEQHNIKVVVVLGGDGAMLMCIRHFVGLDVPIYGANYGTVGFLMHKMQSANMLKDKVMESFYIAKKIKAFPLLCNITFVDQSRNSTLAMGDVFIFRSLTKTNYNNVSFFEQKEQNEHKELLASRAAHLQLQINNSIVAEQLIGDGIIVYTPLGSSGYNHSLNGTILQMESNLIGVSAIAPSFSNNWRNSIVKNDSTIKLTVLNTDMRPCYLSVDGIAVEQIKEVEIQMFTESVTLILDTSQRPEDSEKKEINLNS